jgi:hypothetical protein
VAESEGDPPDACGRGLFATHYHKLADAHADDHTTSIRHMACHVDRDAAGREQVLPPRLFWLTSHLALYVTHQKSVYIIARLESKI